MRSPWGEPIEEVTEKDNISLYSYFFAYDDDGKLADSQSARSFTEGYIRHWIKFNLERSWKVYGRRKVL